MTPEDKAKHQENVKAVIDLLQTLHDGLDIENAEPECLCSYCGTVFETRSIAIEHVSVCEKNPLVAEIVQLHPQAKSQPALLAACEDSLEIIAAIMQLHQATLDAIHEVYPKVDINGLEINEPPTEPIKAAIEAARKE